MGGREGGRIEKGSVEKLGHSKGGIEQEEGGEKRNEKVIEAGGTYSWRGCPLDGQELGLYVRVMGRKKRT